MMAKVFSEEEAEDASWSSTVGEQAGWGSLHGRIEHPKGSNWGGVAEALEAATSSGTGVVSSCLGAWSQWDGGRLHRPLCGVR